MIPRFPKMDSATAKRSTGAALLFAIILIMGMLWIFNDPPGTEYDKPVTQTETSQNQLSDKTPKPIQTNYGWYFFRMIAVTGFLITVIVVGARFYKRKMAQTGRMFEMKVLGKQYISTKQYLMMIKVEDKKILLGITDQSINLLKEYDATDDESSDAEGDFENVLKEVKTDK